MIDTARSPWGSWNSVYASRYAAGPPAMTLASTSTTHKATWLATTYPTVQPERRSTVATARFRNDGMNRRCTRAPRNAGSSPNAIAPTAAVVPSPR